MFPLECAMDELAHQLGIDPIELRRRNEPARDPVNNLSFSSRHLMTCFDQGAEQFGWSKRSKAPASMQDGDWQVGFGCASAAYGSNISSAAVRVTIRPNLHTRVEIAGVDIGTGAYTVVAVTAADLLGLPLDKVAVVMGDSAYPPAALAAGSSHTATIMHATAKACEDIRSRIAHAATVSNASPLAGRDPATLRLIEGKLIAPSGPGQTIGETAGETIEDAIKRLTPGAVEAYAESVPDGSPEGAMATLYSGKNPILRGHKRKDVTAYAFGAQFAEVRVHKWTREIRVPRMLGAYAAGRIVNPLTAHSQYMGGMIWGLGAALLEKTEIDPNAARYVNDNLSEYHIAVNADVSKVEVLIVPEEDARVNPMGIKGIGEVGIVGMNAAIANAVFHATGRRVRSLPIRMEDLL
jgi:xanthine dehydrogenase YagR molybdenum-binding subunit